MSVVESVRGADGGRRPQLSRETIEGILLECRKCLSGLDAEGSGALSGFRGEFGKLVAALERSTENQTVYTSRCAELGDELDKCRRSKEETLAECAELGAARTQLEEEIQSALTDVTQTRGMAESASAEIAACETELATLREEIRRGPLWREDQLEEESRLAGDRDRLASMAESRRQALEASREEEKVLLMHVDRAVAAKKEVRERIRQVEAELGEIHEASRKLQVDKEGMDGRLQQLQDQGERLASQLRVAGEERTSRSAEVTKAEREMRARRAQIEELVREIERLRSSVDRLRREVDAEGRTNEALAEELNGLEQRCIALERDTEDQRRQLAKMERKTALVRQRVQHETQRLAEAEALEAERVREREDIERECAEQRDATRALAQEVEKRRQEREVLRDAIASQADATRAASTIVQVQGSIRAGIESETSAAKRQVARLRDAIEVLQEERARYAKLVEEARGELRSATERIKEETAQGEVASARLAELEVKVRQQKHLFESMRAERNAYAKSVVAAEADIGAMRRRFQTLTFEIEQSKDEVMALNQVLVREHFSLQKLRKETERWTGELATVQKQVQSSEHILAAQSKEVAKLRSIVGEAETERDRQSKELSTVLAERDVLNAQLVARDRELAEVYERLRAQKASLVRGAEQYERRRAEVDAAEALLADLQAEVKLAEAQVGNVDHLDREVKRLTEALDRERSKAAKLMQELARPINVHRWRGLQISDPERFRLIQRVAALQKRLVASQAELETKDVAIADKERLYTQLKDVLARQPGAGEVGEQIRSYEANLKHKRKQLAALRAELDTYRQLVEEHTRGSARATARIHQLEDMWVRAVLSRHKAAEREQRARERDALLSNFGLAYRPAADDDDFAADAKVVPPTEHKDAEEER